METHLLRGGCGLGGEAPKSSAYPVMYRAPMKLPACRSVTCIVPAVNALGFCAMFSLFSYKPIVEYIDAQFEAYLQEELKIKRSLFNYHDTRIHACLYFIAPTGHSLKSLDLVTMKKLDSKVLAAHVTIPTWPY